MRYFLRVFLLVAFVLIISAVAMAAEGASASWGERSGAASVNYPSGPGGVILEGVAAGMERPGRLGFNRRSNSFTLDGGMAYRNPVSWGEWLEILAAINKDERLGVSLTMNMDIITYGGLARRSRIARELVQADKLFAGISFGVPRLIGNVPLPGDYRPVAVPKRNLAIACYNITNFSFEKEENEYWRSNCDLQVFLLAVNKQKAPDGGHLIDSEATKNIEQEVDCTNINHLRDHQAEYLKIPLLAKAVAFGEAAAFARFLRGNGFDLAAMHAAMSIRNSAGTIEPSLTVTETQKESDTQEENRMTVAGKDAAVGTPSFAGFSTGR